MRLIDADALMDRAKEINGIVVYGYGDRVPMKFVKDFVGDLLNETPTIEPVKHGKWIPHPTEPDWDVCSVCGIGTHIRFHYNEGVYGGYDVEESYSYCPHCGAKMDKGEVDG